MAPAVEPSSFPRSHSSPDLLSLPGLDRPAPTFSLNQNQNQRPLAQTLSALPSLPDFDVPTFNTDFSLDTSVFLSGNKATPNLPVPIVRTEEVPRRDIPNQYQDQNETPARPTTSAADMSFGGGSSGKDDSKPLEKSSSTGSFASFAKRSWRSSRSPSPMEKPDAGKENATGRGRSDSITSMKLSKTRKRPGLTVDQADKNQSTDSLKPASKAFRASSYFSKKKQKPTVLSKLNTNTNVGSDNSCASSATSLAPPASTSTEGRNSQSTPVDTTTTVTDESSIEMPQPQTRDTLWSTFKTLDVEFKGFPTKTTAQRMVLVQSLVFPFLRNTMDHESIKSLYPEDVDRRATILNKWWIAMLEMLEGQSPQPLPGVDRQILQAAFLEESSEHNVRTMFVTNLVRQMGFVVEKMSLRHAPVALVNFAGKACAYAFYFAPGVSDILIRLWGLSPELIRRVADEFGLPRRNKGESEDIVALFPPNLSMFGWTTPKGTWDNLKQVPKLPMLVSRIPWTGPWVARWKGRDTDLLFIFTKYFHILSEQFMPPGLPLIEKARSPAFALVHAQLLFVMDTTVHRQTAIDGAYGPALLDSMNGADAAMTLPLPPGNVMKGMSENRLIVLLKDLLSDETAEVAAARHTFAESFASLMKASTRRTSQFNHTSCFTLCDFLEEVLVLYSDFEDPNTSTSYVDWPFWFDVCKKIMSSFNTMSEVRMMSLIFGIWDAIAKDPQRKLALCKDWLLSEETFNDFFNHWCPMVRAYYQRLICWRMCRDNGKQDEVDAKIFILVAKRLRTTWAHYLYLKHTAEQEQRPPPSTAPVLPAPGKRFMIIRQEVNPPQPGLFMGFDALLARNSILDVGSGNGTNDSTSPKNDPKKRWSLLGKVLSLSGAGGSNSSDAGWEDELQAARRDTAEGRSFSPPPSKPSTFNGPKARNSDDDLPIYEEPKFVFKFILAWQNQAAPFRDRFLTRPRLPTPAQSRLVPPPASHNPQGLSGGYTPPKRNFSDSPQLGGLISGARNASPMSSPVDEKPRRLSLSLISAAGNSELSLSDLGDDAAISAARKGSPAPSTPAGETDWNADRFDDGVTHPIKPAGIYTKNVVYAGRSLAEWGQVVFECNNFVERRRDEGVVNIGNMEIPILGVDGFRKLGN
ncbi:hypothetical protein G7Z17_g5694 [Cylindrodendrum hubeiense]|uniref:Uncharacterized protein n=1 Tax=Cylindrodendrum hubeiense TaxID=595255 RepID=A0A9P5HAD7_9HYPO|nr:hypothetical protein G7Z17_g5694 [Cylindrodendrum hubeiense]